MRRWIGYVFAALVAVVYAGTANAAAVLGNTATAVSTSITDEAVVIAPIALGMLGLFIGIGLVLRLMRKAAKST